jgi:DNA-binding SARP family transcriptional activator/tetratricopeptide (TPR) repeat protein
LEGNNQLLLRTLGDVRIEGAEQALSGRRKELAILAYLARHRRYGCTRDELSSLLWEERDRSRARQSLRQALLELKRAVGEALVLAGEQVSIDTSRLRVDVGEMEQHLESGRLAEAVGCWRGEFLPGMEDIGGETFRGWLEGERASLRTRIRIAFVRLTADAASAGAWNDAADWAERWTAVFPLDEDAHRQLAEALSLSGRPAAAVSRLAGYAARVQVELGAPPSPAITALRSTLERSLPSSRRSPALGAAALFTPDLVGREPELSELAAAMAEARGGGSAVVVVEGESGIGKSRLIEEFVRRSRHASNTAVLQSKGRRGVIAEPWSGLGDLMERVATAPGVTGASPEALATLAALAPDLRNRFPAIPTPGASAPRPPTAFADVLGSVTEEVPILLVLDDITRIDTQSVALVVAAVAAKPRGIFLLATLGTDDAPAGSISESLRDLEGFRRLKLPPLDVGQLESLLESMLQLAPADRHQLARRLHDEGGGSPFYAVEMTSALVDEGLLTAAEDGVWRLSGDGDWSFPRPGSIREALTRRLTRLPSHSRAVIEAASVMTAPYDREILRRQSGVEPHAFDEALEKLVAARIMRASPLDGRYLFTQDATPGVVSDMMSPARRKSLERSGREHTRIRWLAGAGVVVAGVAAFAALRARETPTLDRLLVVAAPLRNETGDATLDPIGDLAADWITQGIAESGVVHVVSPQALRASIRMVKAETHASSGETMALARETGAGTVIGGSYYRTGDSLMFQLRISDATSGRILSAPEPIRGTTVDPSPALEQVRERAVGALGLLFGARLSGMSQNASRPPSYAAYAEFVHGLDLHVRYHYSEALDHYHRALALDSTFGSPVVWSALAYWTLDDYVHCDSMLRIADRLQGRLSTFDALLAANQRGELEGNWGAALAAAEEMTRVTTGSEGYILVGQESLRLNRGRQAVEAFRRADPDRGWIKGWEGYWGHLAFAYHITGNLEAALAATKEGHRRYPSSPFSLSYEAAELAALGRTSELDAVISEALSRKADPDWPAAITILQAAIELRAHGHPEAAREMARRGMQARKVLPGPPPRFDPSVDIDLAYRAEDWAEVRRLAEQLVSDSLKSPAGDGYLGVVAARQCDTVEAVRRITTLAHRSYAYGFGEASMWRARIAALLGRKDEAVQLIRLAFSEGSRRDRLDHSMDFEALRGYPAFEELARPSE